MTPATHKCPLCPDMQMYAADDCDDCGSKAVPIPALPVEVWRDTTKTPDYMQAVRSLCGG